MWIQKGLIFTWNIAKLESLFILSIEKVLSSPTDIQSHILELKKEGMCKVDQLSTMS